MPRNTNPAPVFYHQNEPVSSGLMYYFESGTNVPKATYADVSESIQNPHPVVLDSAGRLPNVFFSGSAKQVLTTELGEQVFERDPVGGQDVLGNFSNYNNLIIYGISDIVRYNGNYFESLINNNQGNQPDSDDGTNWAEIDFINPEWSKGKNYKSGEEVTASDGRTYLAVINNVNKDPVSNPADWHRLLGLKSAQDVVANGVCNTGRYTNFVNGNGTHKLPDTTNLKQNDIVAVTLEQQYNLDNPVVEVFNLQNHKIVSDDSEDTSFIFDGGTMTRFFIYLDNNTWGLA